MRSSPPRGIASRAFTARLTITCWICARSTRTRRTSGANAQQTVTSSPRRRESIVPRSVMAPFRSSTTGCRICRRAKARSWRVSAAACWPDLADLRQRRPRRALGRQRALGDVGEAEDRGEEVVEVVGDAGGELADRLHLLRLSQLLLVALARRQVARDRLDRPRRAVGALDPARDLERDAAAVLGRDRHLDRPERRAVAGRLEQLVDAGAACRRRPGRAPSGRRPPRARSRSSPGRRG